MRKTSIYELETKTKKMRLQVVQRIHLPVEEMQETWAQPLAQQDPLEEEMATHSSILAWKIRWAEEPGGLKSTASQNVGHN